MIIYFVIFAAIAARFIPHMPNFAPITALAIFSAANLGWKKSVGITLAARLISDIFLGFFSWPLMVAVYASHLVGVLLGVWIRKSTGVIQEFSSKNIISRKYPESGSQVLDPGSQMHSAGMTQNRWIKIIGSSLLSSVLFFLVTNFAFLYFDYSHNIAGVILAYTNGLPFFRGTLLGDLGYTAALFGSYEFVKLVALQRTKYLISNI